MAVNRGVVVGTVGITLAGIIAAITKKKPVTPVIIAGYLVGLTASILDLAGGDMSVLAGGIVMAAFFGVILTEVPWTTLFGAITAGNSGTTDNPTTRGGPNPH